MRSQTKYELHQQLAAMTARAKRAEEKLDVVSEYAAYYKSTWWLLFDCPGEYPLPFEEWYAQEYPEEPQPEAEPYIGPVCEVCHCRAATRTVTLGGVGVCVCAECRNGRPADVVDAWRVRNAGRGMQQATQGQEA